ncbi:MAG: hypothetical protein LBF49_00465 [Puniceicoccales bacterium]|nr:hypothetical protein [Puniceicoccales bacterium]
MKVPGNFSYPEFPDNSILSENEKRRSQHGTGAADVLRNSESLDVLRDPKNPQQAADVPQSPESPDGLRKCCGFRKAPTGCEYTVNSERSQ